MKKKTKLYGSSTSTYIPCSRGHTIFWTGDPNYEIPEGTNCACGQTKVKYIICKECGNKRIEFIPTTEGDDMKKESKKPTKPSQEKPSKEPFYAVGSISETREIEVFGNTVPLAMKWAEGMVGVIPVFISEEKAKAYAGKTTIVFKLIKED